MYFSLSALTTLAVLAAQATAQVGTNCNITSRYTVVSGDTLSDIATGLNVTVAQIVFVNPSITNPNSIALGQIISIPDSRCVAPAPTLAPALPTATCVKSGCDTYVVVSGDTFTIIANDKLKITLAALTAANPQVQNIDLIFVNQVLNVPVCEGFKKQKKTTKKANKKEPTPSTRRSFKA